MPVACLSGNHQLPSNPIWNQGFAFSRCTRCGRDMMRSHGRWRRAPRGFRIVWKRRTAAKSDPAQLAFDLPPVRDPVAPVPPAPRRRRARLVAAVDLAGAALRLAAWQAAEAARTWLKTAPARHPSRGKVLRIAMN